MEVKQEKPGPRFRCDVCQQGFTRTDHLKRHQLRHSGLKPYVCSFCSDAFARCDSLRNHYSDCSERGDRPIPETDQKGRRRHACELCISMKLRCDGGNPCASCQKRSTACKRPEKAQSPAPTTRPALRAVSATPVARTKSERTPTPTGDRHAELGSIKFLLNGGQDGFMEDWQFPGRLQSIKNSAAVKAQPYKQLAAPPQMQFQAEATNMYAPELWHANLINVPDLSAYRNTFNSFFDGPFDAFHQQWPESVPAFSPEDALWSMHKSNPQDLTNFANMTEPKSANLTALVESLQLTLARLGLDILRQQELMSDLHFLLVPARVRRFTSLYARVWHPNCPIIHMASFDIETAPLPLVASVVFMGAMYSVDSRELSAAKALLDLVEVFVFSSDVFSPDVEIRRAMMNQTSQSVQAMDWIEFQHFQAAYMNVVVQHWAGNALARDRSMEARFSEVVRVARSTSLHKIKHQPEDLAHHDLWIQNECRVRTMNIIHSLDCALLFFHNFPCRLSFAEMDCDLPCDEVLFSSPNPFSEPGFVLSRGVTLSQGFEALFDEDPSESVPSAGGGDCAPSLAGSFTVLDMFLLVHILYSYISAHLVLRAPFAPTKRPSRGTDPRPVTIANHTSSTTAPQPSSSSSASPPQDFTITRVLHALGRWRELWLQTCSTTSADAWTKAGFFKTSYRFWLVAQLVATKHEQVESAWLLEPKCEEKLLRLQKLVG